MIQFKENFLKTHNHYRALHGVPALKLDQRLCKLSEGRAESLASGNTFKYDNHLGENIFCHLVGHANLPLEGNVPVDEWYKEARIHCFDREMTGLKTGHFTQVVWKASTHLGVGLTEAHNRIYVVANYLPGGNIVGQFIENVLPSLSYYFKSSSPPVSERSRNTITKGPPKPASENSQKPVSRRSLPPVSERSPNANTKGPLKPTPGSSQKPVSRRSSPPVSERSPNTITKGPPKLIPESSQKPVFRRSPLPISERSTNTITKGPLKPIPKSSQKPVSRRSSLPVSGRSPNTITKGPPKPVSASSRKPVSSRSSEPASERSPNTITDGLPKPVSESSQKPVSRRSSPPVSERSPNTITKERPKPASASSQKPVSKRSMAPSSGRSPNTITKGPLKPVSASSRKPISRSSSAPAYERSPNTITKGPQKPIYESSRKPVSRRSSAPASKRSPNTITEGPPEPISGSSRKPVSRRSSAPASERSPNTITKGPPKPISGSSRKPVSRRSSRQVSESLRRRVPGSSTRSTSKRPSSKFQKQAPANDKSNESGHFSKFQLESLQVHNEYRKKHKVPGMKLSKKLCDFSQQWADRCVKQDDMIHRPNNKYGENLYYGYSPQAKFILSPRAPVKTWYDEINGYDFDAESVQIGHLHFTQVIWKNSTELGIAMSKNKKGGIYIVANYNPKGNYIGTFKKNVFKANK